MADFWTTLKQLVLQYVPIDYLALHPSTVHSQAADGTIEIVPDNPRIPPIAGVPIKTPFPDTTLTVEAGARVLLGFEQADPTKPYALAWSGTGLVTIDIGGGSFVALADLVEDRLNELKAAIKGAAVGSADGGLTFKTNIMLALEPPPPALSFPQPVAATKVKAK